MVNYNVLSFYFLENGIIVFLYYLMKDGIDLIIFVFVFFLYVFFFVYIFLIIRKKKLNEKE